MAVVVPTLLVMPYAVAFDAPNHQFKDRDQFYEPVYITTAVLENQLAFVSSFVDFGAKIVPQLAIYLSLATISALLIRCTDVTSSSVSTAVAAAPSERTASRPHETTDTANQSTKASTLARQPETSAMISKATTKPRIVRLHAVVKVLVCVWGALVLGLHLQAAKQAQSTTVIGCRAATRPWLGSRASCSSLVVDCHARGANSPTESDFVGLDMKVLATLTFAHCPALHMPPALQRFGNLLVLHLYNSTVMEWGADASAVSAPVHPRLLVVGVARSRFPSGFPEGLLQPLPLSLLSIQFCATDLTTLPDDLPMRWHPMAVVAFEKGIPTEFPASLLALQAFVSSLNGNQIETIPQMAAMPVGQILPEFTLDDNPLHELPPALGSPTNMFVRLGLQGTKLTVLPEWTQTQILLTAYMHDTPYCTNAEAISSQQRTVQCIERAPTDLNVHFPLERIDALYAFGQA